MGSAAQLNPARGIGWLRLAPMCASRLCDRRKYSWLRNLHREAVRFRGLTFCFPGCFERELVTQLEPVTRARTDVKRPAHRIPLGLLMLTRGILSNQQLQRALNEQRRAGGGRIGNWLTNLGFAQDEDISAALASQWSCPIMRKLPDPVGTCGVPIYFLRSFRMVPVQFSPARNTLHIAFADEIPYPVLLAIEEMLGVKTEPCLTREQELHSALGHLQENNRSVEKLFENISGFEETVRIISGYAERLCAKEVRLARCGHYTWARILGDREPADLIFSGARL